MSDRISQKRLAGFLGLTTRQVRNLTDEGVLPKVSEDGKALYEWPESNARYIAYRERLATERATPKDLDEARLRYESARAEMMELDLAQKRGDVLPVDFVGAELDRILQGLRAWLVTFPAAWADRLGACTNTIERQLMLEEAIREAMPLLQRTVQEEPPMDRAA